MKKMRKRWRKRRSESAALPILALCVAVAAGAGVLFPAQASDAHSLAPLSADLAPDRPIHARLLESRPSDGDTLREPPRDLWMLFSEAVDPAVSNVTLHDPRGQRHSLPLSSPPDSAEVLTSPLPDLAPGGHRVEWSTLSADGHRVSGEIAFHVLPPEEPVPEPEEPDPDVEPDEPPVEPDEEDPAVAHLEDPDHDVPVLAAALRGVGVGTLMGAAGLLAFLAWFAPPGGGTTGGRRRRLAAMLTVAAPLLLAGHLVAWLLHAVPPGGGQGLTEWLRTGLGTGTGRMEATRAGLAALAAVALVLPRGRHVAAAAALAAVAVGGAIGHSAVYEPVWSIPLNALHMVGVAVWLGGLAFLVAAAAGREGALVDARRVSTLALGAVVVVTLTGLGQALILVPEPGDLLASSYGLGVLGKTAGLLVLVAFGARHRFRLIPGLERGEDPDGLRRSVRWEVVAMIAVVLLAGLLAYTSPPAH